MKSTSNLNEGAHVYNQKHKHTKFNVVEWKKTTLQQEEKIVKYKR